MSIRARIEDAMILYTIGRPEAALLSVLVAVAATSRRRRPPTSPSVRKPGKLMMDREAFESFLADEMPRICRVVNYNILYRAEMHRIEHIFYKWMRSSLAHEAELPADICFDRDPTPGVFRSAVRADGTLVLSHGWLNGLADAVIYASENADQFGTPPQPPSLVPLPNINITVDPGGQAGSEFHNPAQVWLSLPATSLARSTTAAASCMDGHLKLLPHV
jgi:hypothetical protein